MNKMPVITLYHSKGRWRGRTGDPRVPQWMDDAPVFDELDESVTGPMLAIPEIVKRRVEACNPGHLVIVQKEPE